MQSGAKEEVLRAVLAHPGTSLAEVASHPGLAIDRSTVLRHLQSLVRDGIIAREGQGRRARYRPLETFRVSWTAPLGGSWHRLEWASPPPFDLRFPLVGRVPDERARSTILRFLSVMEERGFHSLRAFHRVALDEGVWPPWLKGSRESERSAYRRFVTSNKFDLAPTVVAYGSCARGDAREGSDVDLLFIAPTVPPGLKAFAGQTRAVPVLDVEIEEGMKDLAAEISLGASRPIDLVVTDEGSLDGLNPGLLRTIAKEGKTIYGRPDNSSYFVEAWPARMAA